MKNLTLKILRTGYTTSKKPLEDYIKYLYLLKYIFKTDSVNRVSCNGNPFWEHTNNENRMDLYCDIMNMHGKKLADGSYYKIINRFENGDKYGISTDLKYFKEGCFVVSQIKHIKGDILTASNLDGFVAICHQVNCKGVMGAGLAKQIKGRYPMVYSLYKKVCFNRSLNPPEMDKSPLLGKIQILYPEKGSPNPDDYYFCIVNCFGQDGYGRNSVQTDYGAVKECFRKINDMFSGKRVALPYKFGCGLAGGEWDKVYSLIEKELSDCNVEIWEYNSEQ